MATATRKVPVAGPRARNAARSSDRASLSFDSSQDNGGDHLWEIADSSGKTLVRSGVSASREDAERAAHHAHESARLAHFGPRDPEARETVVA